MNEKEMGLLVYHVLRTDYNVHRMNPVSAQTRMCSINDAVHYFPQQLSSDVGPQPSCSTTTELQGHNRAAAPQPSCRATTELQGHNRAAGPQLSCRATTELQSHYRAAWATIELQYHNRAAEPQPEAFPQRVFRLTPGYPG